MVYAANAVLIVASMVPRQTTETARASCVVSGKKAKAKMSVFTSESMRNRKVLVFMGLGWLSFNEFKSDVFSIGLRFKILHYCKRISVREWV